MSPEGAEPSATARGPETGRTAGLKLVAARTLLGFQRQGGADAAASLTYLAFLALFPITLSAVSALAILTDHADAEDTILAVVSAVAPPAGVAALRAPLQALSAVPLPGVALTVGVVLTIWTVSSYAACFGRAVNRFHGVEEGRPFLRVRITMLLLALPLCLGGAIVGTIVLTTPRIGKAVAVQASIGTDVSVVWQFVKWPILLGVLALMLGALYRWTPNVRRQGISPIGWGALIAILGWAVLSLGFALYVTGIGRYRVYGWLTGALVITLWLYLSNLMLVLGASLDTEVLRLHQLRAGLSSESLIREPLRDVRRTAALQRRQDALEAAGRALAANAAEEAQLPWARPRRVRLSAIRHPITRPVRLPVVTEQSVADPSAAPDPALESATPSAGTPTSGAGERSSVAP